MTQGGDLVGENIDQESSKMNAETDPSTSMHHSENLFDKSSTGSSNSRVLNADEHGCKNDDVAVKVNLCANELSEIKQNRV